MLWPSNDQQGNTEKGQSVLLYVLLQLLEFKIIAKFKINLRA